ncbi:hypothetical protein LT493_17190 [Streptomyces tricolor]|nr:hypothetical protein [Streptomyces tricolor]
MPALVRAGYQTVTSTTGAAGPGPTGPFGLDDLVEDAARLIEAPRPGPAGWWACRWCHRRAGVGAAPSRTGPPGRLHGHPRAHRCHAPGDGDGRDRAEPRRAQRLSTPHRGVLRAMQNLSQSTLADDSRAQDWIALTEGPLDTGDGVPVPAGGAHSSPTGCGTTRASRCRAR